MSTQILGGEQPLSELTMTDKKLDGAVRDRPPAVLVNRLHDAVGRMEELVVFAEERFAPMLLNIPTMTDDKNKKDSACDESEHCSELRKVLERLQLANERLNSFCERGYV